MIRPSKFDLLGITLLVIKLLGYQIYWFWVLFPFFFEIIFSVIYLLDDYDEKDLIRLMNFFMWKTNDTQKSQNKK